MNGNVECWILLDRRVKKAAIASLRWFLHFGQFGHMPYTGIDGVHCLLMRSQCDLLQF